MQYLKLGAACYFIRLFPMVQHVPLPPAGMNQASGQTERKQKGRQRINSQTLHNLFGTSMLLSILREAIKYVSPENLVNQGASKAPHKEYLQTLFDQTLLQDRKIQKEGLSKRCHP